MDSLRMTERPGLRSPYWIGAFTGWADAQESATEAVRYMVRQLQAKKFAEIDAEEFYDFTAVRPVAFFDEAGVRRIRWPANNFYYWTSEGGEKEVVFFVGTEPSLKWRTFTGLLLSAVAPYRMRTMMTLGALNDALPHTREASVTGSANRPELDLPLEGMSLGPSRYAGPVGITSAFLEGCNEAGLAHLSLWAHAPHYVQRSPNYTVTKALVQRLNRVLGLNVPLGELEAKAQEFTTEVTTQVSKSVEASAYVKKLERLYDEALTQRRVQELPTGESAVRDVEEFLRRGEDGGRPGGS